MLIGFGVVIMERFADNRLLGYGGLREKRKFRKLQGFEEYSSKIL